MGKVNLFGLDRAGLREFLEPFEVPRFRSEQIFRWLYGRRVHEVERWTDLSAEFRRRLQDKVLIDTGEIAGRVRARDGTTKYRVRFYDGSDVECVFMVQDDRVTLCLSSQVGCALACDFCMTGKMGLRRHLSSGEIAAQVMLIERDGALEERPFNIVFMGMGEPLHNFDALRGAIGLLTDPAGFGISRKRITVSTVGLAPAIERLADETVRPRLAVSLNAPRDDLRERLMPINRRYPLRRLLEACTLFQERSGERMTFEYVLLSGVNDSEDDIAELARLVRRQRAKLNLIPFNPVPGKLPYGPPTRSRILHIRDTLLASGVPVSIRWSRGLDAQAACGQLALLGEYAGGPRPASGP